MANVFKVALTILLLGGGIIYMYMNHWMTLAPLLGFLVLVFVGIMVFFTGVYACLFVFSIFNKQRIDLKIGGKVLLSFAILVVISYPTLRLSKNIVFLSTSSFMGEFNIPDSYYDLVGEPDWPTIQKWEEEDSQTASEESPSIQEVEPMFDY
jgi:hypothetical protein